METQIFETLQTVSSLEVSEGQVTTTGNQLAFANFLIQAMGEIQQANNFNSFSTETTLSTFSTQQNAFGEAVQKIEMAIERTDGCALRGSPDGHGKGMDWITDCASQTIIYFPLMNVLNELSPITCP